MKNFLINGTNIHFEEVNEGRGLDTIVFIHGNSHSLATFCAQKNSQILSKYHLLFVDLPGHGLSGKMLNYSLTSIGEMLNALIAHLGLTSVILAAHSLGGHVAINMIKSKEADFINPKGLFLFGTPPLKNPFDPNAFLPNARAIALSQEHPSMEDIDSLMQEIGYKGEQKEQAVKDYSLTDFKFRTNILGDVINGTNVNEVDTLKTYDGDLMFLLALKDRLINNSYIKECSLGSANYQEILSGHSPHIETAEEFNLYLKDFCDFVFDTNINKEIKSLYATRNIEATKEGIKNE